MRSTNTMKKMAFATESETIRFFLWGAKMIVGKPHLKNE